jgi:F0F1-type ATP synthase assembly protein I
LQNQPKVNPWLKYSNLAFQMIGVIVSTALVGKYLDKWLNTSFPLFTLVLVLFGVFAALYLVLKDLLKK